MGGGSINGRTKFDALLVVQIRLREMSLVGMRQGNAEAEVAAGGRLARDQNKGFDEFLRRRSQADMRGTYGRGSSYARRGTHYVRGHYSRADSMEHLREQINDMMRETDDDRVKEALRRAASLMEE